MLNAVEFKATIKQGFIEIPEEYQQDLVAESEVRVIVIKQVKRTTSQSPIKVSEQSTRPIWELFEEVADNLPDEILADLPTDGSAQHDHYLYGSPKQ